MIFLGISFQALTPGLVIKLRLQLVLYVVLHFSKVFPLLQIFSLSESLHKKEVFRVATIEQ